MSTPSGKTTLIVAITNVRSGLLRYTCSVLSKAGSAKVVEFDEIDKAPEEKVVKEVRRAALELQRAGRAPWVLMLGKNSSKDANIFSD